MKEREMAATSFEFKLNQTVWVGRSPSGSGPGVVVGREERLTDSLVSLYYYVDLSGRGDPVRCGEDDLFHLDDDSAYDKILKAEELADAIEKAASIIGGVSFHRIDAMNVRAGSSWLGITPDGKRWWTWQSESGDFNIRDGQPDEAPQDEFLTAAGAMRVVVGDVAAEEFDRQMKQS